MANFDISIINEICIRRRIKNELNSMVNKYLDINSTIDVNIITNKISNMYKIGFYNIKDLNYYEFFITSNYPFTPPKLSINHKSYINNNHRIDSVKFKEDLFKYKGIRCFCCETILCGNNWGPQMTLSRVLDEVETFRSYVREISHRVIVNIIKRKYLIDDINIIEWLY